MKRSTGIRGDRPIKRRARSFFWQNKGRLIFLCLLASLPSLVGGAVTALLPNGWSSEAFGQAVTLLGFPLMLGFSRMALELWQGETLGSAAALFRFYRPAVLGKSLLLGLFLSLPGYAVMVLEPLLTASRAGSLGEDSIPWLVAVCLFLLIAALCFLGRFIPCLYLRGMNEEVGTGSLILDSFGLTAGSTGRMIVFLLPFYVTLGLLNAIPTAAGELLAATFSLTGEASRAVTAGFGVLSGLLPVFYKPYMELSLAGLVLNLLAGPGKGSSGRPS